MLRRRMTEKMEGAAMMGMGMGMGVGLCHVGNVRLYQVTSPFSGWLLLMLFHWLDALGALSLCSTAPDVDGIPSCWYPHGDRPKEEKKVFQY